MKHFLFALTLTFVLSACGITQPNNNLAGGPQGQNAGSWDQFPGQCVAKISPNVSWYITNPNDIQNFCVCVSMILQQNTTYASYAANPSAAFSNYGYALEECTAGSVTAQQLTPMLQ